MLWFLLDWHCHWNLWARAGYNPVAVVCLVRSRSKRIDRFPGGLEGSGRFAKYWGAMWVWFVCRGQRLIDVRLPTTSKSRLGSGGAR